MSALLEPIYRQGDPGIPVSEKVEVISTGADLLSELGVHPDLVAELASFEGYARELGCNVLARRPQDDERDMLEGRGVYHKNTKIHGTTVYVKGTGNEVAFDQNSISPVYFPGFPREPEKLFFDNRFLNAHPRILGTETLRWGLLEHISAAVVFACLAEKFQWKNLQEAISAGVSIPLQVIEFKELSGFLHAMIPEGISWRGNEHLGTVSLIVPSAKRIRGGVDGSECLEELVKRITSRLHAKNAGKTLKALLDCGICYSYESAHGQNLYAVDREVVCAQADNSDFVTLGDYKGIENSEINPGELIYITKGTQRHFLLFCQLNRHDLLTPLDAPDPDKNIYWEDLEQAHKAFWKELLPGNTIVSDIFSALIPVLRTEINMAVAHHLVATGDSKKWERVADTKRNLITRYAWLGVQEEYVAKVENNLPYDLMQEFHELTMKNRLPINTLIEFIETGNKNVLYQDKRIILSIELMSNLNTISSRYIKNRLLKRCSMVFGRRDVDDKTGDIIAQFNSEPLNFITKLINSRRYDEAEKSLQIFQLLGESNFSEYSYLHSMSGELRKHYYPYELFHGDRSFLSIYEDCISEYQVNLFTLKISLSMKSLLEKVAKNDNKVSILTNIQKFIRDTGRYSIDDIIRNVYGTKITLHENRREIVEYLTKYNSIASRISETSHRSNPNSLVEELGIHAETIRTDFPHLYTGYCMAMLEFWKNIDEDKAIDFYRRIKEYYNSEAYFEYHHNAKKNKGWTREDADEKYTSYISKYGKAGYHMIAKYYEATMKGEMFPVLW